jgi:geranylgeranyl pyrophosphate synthase
VNDQLTTVNFLTPVQDLIPKVEERMRSQADRHHPELKTALDHLLGSGGKRIRPAVALLTGRMLGAAPDRLVTLSAALELLHTATLVHDDLIDGALLRRGIATLNSQWSPAATVLTGDFVFARAAKLAAETESLPLMHLFAETLATIVNGEITQLFSSKGLASREDYNKRIYAKTASLFELATKAAAMLSPVAEEDIEKAHHFGYNIGMAFQIVDDVLDFTGEQATIGKPVASDLRMGLITLPALYFLENFPDSPELKTVLSGKQFNDGIMDRLLGDIRGSGAIQRAMDEAHRYVECGLVALSGLPNGLEHEALIDLANYIVDRRL